MNENRVFSVVEWTLLFFLWGLILSFCFIGNVQAEDDGGWLVRQKDASPTGQWILFENGATELIPLPPGLEGKDIGEDSPLPSGFDRGKKEGWDKGEHQKKQAGPRKPADFVDTRVYGDGTPRKPADFVDTRVYGDGKPRRKPEMFDPYGHSKDDRLEVCGNRGRVVGDCELGGEEPTPEPEPTPQTFTHTEYLLFDWQTYYAIVDPSLYGLTLEMLGYSPEEIAFLKSLSGTQQAEAWRQGYAAMPAVEKPLLPISELNLSQVVNYAGATNTDPGSYYAKVTGSTVEYAVSFTNPYNEPLTVTISATIQYTPPASDSTLGRGTVYATNPYYFQNYQLDSYALAGESTQVWQNVTLEPGETLVLNDTYNASGQTYGQCGFNYGTVCHSGDGVINIGYTIGVTVTDVQTGATYSDPAAGWFNASSSIFGYGYDYSGSYLYELHQAALS